MTQKERTMESPATGIEHVSILQHLLEPSRTATSVKYPYLEYPHRQSDLADC